MKKKLLSILLAGSMVVSLAACGGAGGTTQPAADSQTETKTEAKADDSTDKSEDKSDGQRSSFRQSQCLPGVRAGISRSRAEQCRGWGDDDPAPVLRPCQMGAE